MRYNRNWVYHKVLKIWITEDTPPDKIKILVYFDINTWSKRCVKEEFTHLDWSQEQINIMPREEVFNL